MRLTKVMAIMVPLYLPLDAEYTHTDVLRLHTLTWCIGRHKDLQTVYIDHRRPRPRARDLQTNNGLPTGTTPDTDAAGAVDDDGADMLAVLATSAREGSLVERRSAGIAGVATVITCPTRDESNGRII